MPKALNKNKQNKRRQPSQAVVVRPFSVVNQTQPRQPETKVSGLGDASLSVKAAVGVEPAAASAAKSALVGGNHVVGFPGFMGPGLRPIMRTQVSSIPYLLTWYQATGELSEVMTADPFGSTTVPVNGFATRFRGFQQYRVRSVEWHITPTRATTGTLVNGYVAAQMMGAGAFWISDTPNGVPPNANDFQRANRLLRAVNSDKELVLVYGSNEPQDLDLIDINSSPNHLSGGVILAGCHDLLGYGAQNQTALGLSSYIDTVCFTVHCVYDLEFFGIGN